MYWENKIYFGSGLVIGSLIYVLIFQVFGVNSFIINVDGQGTIDALTQQLTLCQDTVAKYDSVAKTVCECNCPYPDYGFGTLIAG